MWLFKKKRKSPRQRTCLNCHSYGCQRSNNKLNPDKTVTKGKVEYEYCFEGQFQLKDYSPCQLHRFSNHENPRRIVPPPIPKKG